MSYTPLDYASMLGDKGRMDAYTNALKRAITPESIVLDLGTGTGYFAVLACFLGAKHVYAIEPNPAISIGKDLARSNGVGDRITWYEKFSTDVHLPEKVDLIVSDLRGLLPQNEGNISSIKDARKRFLKPGGILLPKKDRLWMGIASDFEAFMNVRQPWFPVETGEVDLSSYTDSLANTFVSREGKADSLLAPSQLWTEIDYYQDETLNHRDTLTFEIEKAGTGHGFYLWFEAQVDDQSSYSFAPGAPMTVYGSAFFPWKEPLELAVSDSLRIDLSVHFGPDGYDWSWNTQHCPANNERPRIQFKQSTFLNSSATGKEDLKKQTPTFKPRLNEKGKIALTALNLMEQGLSLEEIATQLKSTFPERNKSSESWLRTVSDLSYNFAD